MSVHTPPSRTGATMRIEECVPCPQCGFKRVVQRGYDDAYFCFQCRHAWSSRDVADRHEREACHDPLDQFPRDMRARLIAYRGAIRAGVYTDWPFGARTASIRTDARTTATVHQLFQAVTRRG